MDEIKIFKTQDNYGLKIAVISPFNEKLIKAIKSLDWNSSHRKWTGSFWSIDYTAGEELSIALREFGFEKEALKVQALIKNNEKISKKEELNLNFRLQDNSLIVKSRYDSDLVLIFKECKGWWSPNEKTWSFSIDRCLKLHSKLLEFDKTCGIPDDLLEEIKARLEEFENEKNIVTIEITNQARLYPLSNVFPIFENFSKWIREHLGFKHPKEKEIRRWSTKNLENWDGRIVPVNYEKNNGRLESLKFGIAYVPFIKKALELKGLEVKIDDKRSLLQLDHETNFNLNLYECQKSALNYVIDQLKNNGCCMYQLPTGVGKTITAIAVIDQLKVKTIVLVNRKDLMYQWQAEISERLGIPIEKVGIVGDGIYDPQEITIATVQSLWKYLQKEAEKETIADINEDLIDRFIDTGIIEDDYAPISPELFQSFSLVILDEVHIGAANTFVKVLQAFTSKYYLGQSATTWRTDRMHPLLWGIFNKPEFQMNINDAIKLGHIVPPVVKILEGVEIYKSEYRSAIKEMKENEERNMIIAKAAKEAPKPCLILTNQVSHQNYIKKALKKIGETCIILNGKTTSKIRKKVLKMMKDKDPRASIVCATPIWDEGVDAPGIASVILAFPTKSDVKLYQRIGRGLRTAPGKDRVIIYDIKDEQKHLTLQFKNRLEVYRQNGWLLPLEARQ